MANKENMLTVKAQFTILEQNADWKWQRHGESAIEFTIPRDSNIVKHIELSLPGAIREAQEAWVQAMKDDDELTAKEAFEKAEKQRLAEDPKIASVE